MYSNELSTLSQIHHLSNTSINWALYLCGVKRIIVDGLKQRKIDDQDLLALRDWVYFYEVLARFGLLHWIRKNDRDPICLAPPASESIQTSPKNSTVGSFYLSALC